MRWRIAICWLTLALACSATTTKWALKAPGIISVTDGLIGITPPPPPPPATTTNLVLGKTGAWITDQLARYSNAVVLLPGVPATNAGGRCWLDYSTNGFNAYSATAPDPRTNGNWIADYYNSGSAEYLSLTGGLARINALTNYTICAWTMPLTNANGSRAVFALTVGGTSYNSLRLEALRGLKYQFYCYHGGTPLHWTTTGEVVTNGSQQFIVAVQGSATNQFYLNAKEVPLTYTAGSGATYCPMTMITNAVYVRVGYNVIPAPYTYPWEGDIGWFRLYDRALTAAEITDIYTNTAQQGGF